MNSLSRIAAASSRPLRVAGPLALTVAGMTLVAACGPTAGSAGGSPSTGTRSSAGTAPSASPSSGAPSTPASSGQNITVDLTFSGAINAHLTGTGPGRCSYYDVVHNRGLDYEVRGQDFGHPELGLLQLSGNSATATPAVIMNTPNASYGWYPSDGGTVSLKGDRTGATIDAPLTKIASTDKIQVTGTIACS